VTSMQDLLGHEVEVSAVEDSIIKNFVDVFETVKLHACYQSD